jgi:uncharacterized protein (TIGR03118 family)
MLNWTTAKGRGVLAKVTAATVALGAASAWAQPPYRLTPLVSDIPGVAPNTDGNLVNAWGVAFNPMGFAWVADNGTGVATLYDGHGTPNALIVNIPSDQPDVNGAPTGIVFSGGNDFEVTNGTATAPARFIFATENGVISGWAPQVDLTHAIAAAGDVEHGAVYKGLALGDSLLFATDFHNAKVDVFDGSFGPVKLAGGAFSDPHLPAHFAPFGIQVIDGNVFVTFAMQDAAAHDDVKGRGLGAIDVFDQSGHLLSRVAAGGKLNAPWGIARSPSNFGKHSNQLLVGNFGDGRINTFEIKNGQWKSDGQLIGQRGGPITIDGLWGISFGNGLLNQPTNTLFAAAGPDGENHGFYGRIDPPSNGNGH